MALAKHWISLYADAPDPEGFDPVLERVRERARPLRLHPLEQGEADDLGRLLVFVEASIGRRLSILRPSTVEKSFDEDWLSAIFRARLRGDGASYRFLLLSRMTKDKASEAHFLVCRAQLALAIGQ